MRIEINQNNTYALSLILEGISEPVDSLVFSIRPDLLSDAIDSKIIGRGVVETDKRPYKQEVSYKIQLDNRDTIFLIPDIEYAFDIVVTVGSRIKTLQTGILVVHPSITDAENVLAVTPPETPELPYVPFERDVLALQTIGNLKELTMDSKLNVVSAVNELNAEKQDTDDKSLNTVSKNVVGAVNEVLEHNEQNKAKLALIENQTEAVQAERDRIDTLASEAYVQGQEADKNKKDIYFIRGYTYNVVQSNIDWSNIEKGINWTIRSYVWTNEDQTYYSAYSRQYVWDGLNKRWIPHTWKGFNDVYGFKIFFDGKKHYYHNWDTFVPSYNRDYVLVNGDTWEEYQWQGHHPENGRMYIIDGQCFYKGSDGLFLFENEVMKPRKWYRKKDGYPKQDFGNQYDLRFWDHDGVTYLSEGGWYRYDGVDTWYQVSATADGGIFPSPSWWFDGYVTHDILLDGTDRVYKKTQMMPRKQVDIPKMSLNGIWHDAQGRYYYSIKDQPDRVFVFCNIEK